MRKLLVLFVLVAAAFAADGSFTGQVVNGPNLDANKKWVFIQGARGPVRRVDINDAKVSFGAEMKKRDKAMKPEDAIREGAELRVTASLDGEGDWKASRVEVVRVAPK